MFQIKISFKLLRSTIRLHHYVRKQLNLYNKILHDYILIKNLQITF